MDLHQLSAAHTLLSCSRPLSPPSTIRQIALLPHLPCEPISTSLSRHSAPWRLLTPTAQIHLLASFPSDSDNSDDPSALPHLLPEYKRSLDSRYPLLCAACAPAVEEVIKERDYRAKTQALGWRLNASRGLKKEKEKREQRRRKEGWDWWCLGVVWRIRGAAWWGTHVAGIVACLLGKQASVVCAKLETDLLSRLSTCSPSSVYGGFSFARNSARLDPALCKVVSPLCAPLLLLGILGRHLGSCTEGAGAREEAGRRWT